MASNTKKNRPAPTKSSAPAANKAGKQQSDVDVLLTKQQSGSTKKFPWVWVIVGALVVLAAGIAVLSAGGDEEASVGTVAPDGSSSSAGETQPVTIDGDALVPLEDPADDPAVGTTAPVLSGFDFDGNPIAIEPDGSPKLVVFLAHWCPHCNAEIPVLNEWKDAGLVPEGLEVIGVSTAVAPRREFYPPSEWLDDKEWTWPVMADSTPTETSVGDAADAFGVSGFPTMVVLGGDGTVLARTSGEMSGLALQAFIADALASA